MLGEGETELRDSIVQSMESSGFLNKIKAELRAGVFLAFEEEGSLKTKSPLHNQKFEDYVSSSDGMLAVSLVREFLEYFNLKFTLSVFDPETSSTSPCLNRNDLCNKLSIKNLELEGPVLSVLLKSERKDDKTHTENLISQTTSSSLNSKKSLETISGDFPVKDKTRSGKTVPHDTIQSELHKTFDIGNHSFDANPSNGTSVVNKKSLDAIEDSSGIINKLLQDRTFDKSNSLSDTFGIDSSDANIFKVKANSSLDLDNFFDDPLPTEKSSFFSESKLNLKDASQSNPGEKTLSSLKGLPALTATKGKDWSFKSELTKPLSNFNPPTEVLKKEEIGTVKKTDPDPESNEELSDRQLNSEESIEEEIEEDLSAGLEDLLNSSLSLADDATTDQSTSKKSLVDGVDHIEPVTN